MSKRVVFISGGVAGIGLCLARQFLSMGDEVIVCGRSRERLQLVSATEPDLHVLQADVTLSEEVASLGTFIEQHFGKLDVLIHNAGAFYHGPVLEQEEWQIYEQFASNSIAGVLLLKQFEALLLQSETPQVINLSASYADDMQAHPEFGIFAAANAAQVSLTKTLAVELAGKGIRVNSVGPGMIDTGVYTDSAVKRYSEIIPAGRLGTVDEIAHAVSFLIDEKSGYITGVHVPLAGGWQGDPA